MECHGVPDRCPPGCATMAQRGQSHQGLSLEKTVRPWKLAESLPVVGCRYLSGITALFTCLSSRQGHRPPVRFFVTTRLDIQGEVSTRSMMPASQSLVSSCVTSARKARGSRHSGWKTWSQRWISEWLVVEGGEAMLPGLGHRQYSDPSYL